MPRQKKHRFHDGRSGSAIAVHVVLKAKDNHIQKITPDGVIWVAMAHQKLDQMLNRDLLTFLAHIFKVNIRDLEIVGGDNGEDKWITVIGPNPEQIQAILENLLS